MKKVFDSFILLASLFFLVCLTTIHVASAHKRESSSDANHTYKIDSAIEKSLDSAPDDVKNLVRIELALDNMCRGGSTDRPATEFACTVRKRLEDQIKARGWCYKSNGAPASDRHWQRCSQSTPTAAPASRRSRPANRLDGKSGQNLYLTSQPLTLSTAQEHMQPHAGMGYQETKDDIASKPQDAPPDSRMALGTTAILLLFLVGLLYLAIA